jgi:hypothetical protein
MTKENLTELSARLPEEASVIEYQTHQFPFAELIADILNVRRLDQVHVLCPIPERLTVGKDQATPIHDAFYNRMSEMLPMYRAFVREIIGPIFQTDEIVYQSKPTFRVHLPGNVAVGEFHRDSDYRHQPKEINFWVPVTDTNEDNTIWIERTAQSENYSPCMVKPGQVLMFMGGKYKHGNRANRSAHSRVSFDFRVLAFNDYDAQWTGASHNTDKQFVIGGYYSKIHL